MPVSDNMRGAVLMMLSMAAFTLNDTFIKSVAGDLPLFQAIFLRGVMTTALLTALALYQRQFRLKLAKRDRKIIGLRTLAELGATTFFLTALFHMPIANVTAILQILPLAITLAGAMFLGEAVGWRRYGAIFLGFLGVMLIVRPGGAGFDVYSISVLIAVGFVVLRDLSTRRLSPDVPSIMVALITAIAVTTMGGIVTLFGEWHAVTTGSLTLLAGASVFIVGGYLLAVMVMRVGDISFVAPFRYTSLIWAIVLGVLVFGEFPDNLTLIGSAIVIGMGIFTYYRELQIAKAD